MTDPKQKTKKISRRDAIKLLGAVTGATVLANLPTKWNTPEIASGVLPAHAQTSNQSVLPTVTTDNLVDQSIGDPLMDFYGTVVSDGGSPVTVRGFVWSSSP